MSKSRTIVMITILLVWTALGAGEDTKTRIKDGIVRGDLQKKALALVFTGDTYAEGGNIILDALKKSGVKASFFLTGNFLRNPQFQALLKRIIQEGHYLGPHSDRHLLYLSWTQNQLLVGKDEFTRDVQNNLQEIATLGVGLSRIKYWIPPYEHYNETVVQWGQELGLTLLNYSPGTISHADYTGEQDSNFRSSQQIINSILKKEKEDPNGLNGFILLLHIGAGAGRKDKFHLRFPELLDFLTKKDYKMVRVDELL
jgi:peptidoglycan/xylan/chitin deacetylase (PgdA/CDA1 family)